MGFCTLEIESVKNTMKIQKNTFKLKGYFILKGYF